MLAFLLTARALTNNGSLIDNVTPQTSIEAAAAITTANAKPPRHLPGTRKASLALNKHGHCMQVVAGFQ